MDDEDLFAGVPIYERWNGKGFRYKIISLADWLDDEIMGHRFHRICLLIEGCPWWELGNNIGTPARGEC